MSGVAHPDRAGETAKPKPKVGPFVVWSPDGETPPKVVHRTHQAAHSAAHMMAKAHPGQTFMVMAKSGRAIRLSDNGDPS